MHLTCPHCGHALVPVALGPETAPWLCSASTGGCSTGWFHAQLTQEGRATWRPEYQDHGYAHHIHEAMQAERDEAHERGTSARHDQIALLHPDIRAELATRAGVHKALKAAIQAHEVAG